MDLNKRKFIQKAAAVALMATGSGLAKAMPFHVHHRVPGLPSGNPSNTEPDVITSIPRKNRPLGRL